MKGGRGGERGMALVLVLGIVSVAAVTVSGLFTLLRSRTLDLAVAEDRLSAQYLCETAASAALLDIARGKVGTGAGRWTRRSFPFSVGARVHELSYSVKKSGAQWEIETSVKSPGSLGLTYTMRLGGRRAFPIYVLGGEGG